MICWRFGVRTKLLHYVEGELGPRDVERVEQHLFDCERCRALLVRLRAGHRWAQQLPSIAPEDNSVGAWELGIRQSPRESQSLPTPASFANTKMRVSKPGVSWLDRFTTRRGVAALAMVVLVQLGLLVASNRRLLFGQRSGAPTGALDLSEFHPLRIRDLKFNTEPHIAIQGYVRDVHADEEEGTVAFELFDDPKGSGSFVVCEIMSPISMPAPHEGSYVRVYGVARYDAQAQRNWYEVNPVLSIASPRE